MKLKKRVSLLLLVVLIPVSIMAQSISLYVDGHNQEGWPAWRGVTHDGKSSDTNWTWNISQSRNQLWSAQIGSGYSAPSVSGDNVVIMGSNNRTETVTCLDTLTGRVKWEFDYPTENISYEGPRSSPTIDGDRVYTLSPLGMLYCLNLSNGRVIWQKNLVSELGVIRPEWNLTSSVIIEGDLLLINANQYGIALNKSGGVVWSSPSGMGGYASPVVFTHKGRRSVAMFSSEYLYVVDVYSGNVLYSYSWPTEYGCNSADPIYFDNKIFIASGYNKGCVLLDISGSSARVLWQNKNMKAHFSSPFYRDGVIYGSDGGTFNSRGAKLVALDVANGEVLWSERSGLSSLITVNDYIISLNDRGDLSFYEYSSSSYSELNTITVLDGTCWTAPVFAYGLIFLRNDYGELICLNARAR